MGNQKYLETDENANMVYQNLWNATKAVLTGKFIAVNAYIKTHTHTKILNKQLYTSRNRKTKTTQPKVSEKKEMIKIRSAISKIETRNLKRSN